MVKKYELLQDDTIVVGDTTLYRIRALRDFGFVSAGDLGGYIRCEDNLSHEDTAWVDGDAKVSGNTRVGGYAKVSGNARVGGYAEVDGNAWVGGDTVVCGYAEVIGYAKVSGNAWVGGDTVVSGNAEVGGDTVVSGNAEVGGYARVSGNARVLNNKDFMCLGPIGSRDDYVTFARTKDINDIWVTTGCFRGRLLDFMAEVQAKHGNNVHGQAYMLAVELAKLRIFG